MPKRSLAIDHLRGIAIIAMILIHTSYYFISKDKVALFLWNWSQFAVPLFVFCSGYVFFIKDRLQSFNDFIPYLIKRLPRLLLPYYIFMLFFLPIIWITTGKVTTAYISQSIILIGGIDINWLVLLMIELAIAFPIIRFLQKKIPLFFYIYILIAIIFSFSTFYSPLHSNYKYTMWLPWSLMGSVSVLSFPSVHKKIIPLTILIAGVVFILLYFQGIMQHHDISFINNKYPPDIFILSYGVLSCFGLFWLSEKGIFRKVSQPLTFLSKHSYSLYFIHYCLLIFFASYLQKIHTTWYIFFAGIFFGAVIIQILYERAIFLVEKHEKL